MSQFPYSQKPASVAAFLEKMQTVGVPKKVTYKYIKSIGFKSKNDRAVVSILKALGFLDPSGVPTDRWRDYRDKRRAPAVLAQGIREAYSGLFAVYDDAYRKDDEALTDFFKPRSDVAESTVNLMVRTFKTLCQVADFEAAPEEVVPTEKVSVPAESGEPATSVRREINVTLNIQLALPATKDSGIYDSLFESLKKHLLSSER